MKPIFLTLCMLSVGALVSAASYTNNTYQKLADEYTKQAQSAFNAGEYDRAVELSIKAEENAALSRAYIERMMLRQNAETELQRAYSRLAWAKSIDADRNFPMAYTAASESYNTAQNAFQGEDYETAKRYAQQVIASLDGVRQITPLPEYYVVRPWADTKDCYWNISGRPYVYNNPLLWENLYQDAENKRNMPDASNPNLIYPGMRMKIPSLTGEYRSGVYNPAQQYDPYSVNR
ncbi:MAG: hypothetical protein IJ191_07110 [Treponema sp.]|nr:hypothetical protein [Treponema sp.]